MFRKPRLKLGRWNQQVESLGATTDLMKMMFLKSIKYWKYPVNIHWVFMSQNFLNLLRK